MADEKLKDRDAEPTARPAGKRGTAAAQGTAGHGNGGGTAADAAGGQHHAASAHGRPARIDKSLPANRPALIALHAEARRRRSEAALGSESYRAAADEIARIEIRIADVDRAMEPPQG